MHVVVIGGHDPSGGAGIFRDFATVSLHGELCTAVGTAWTIQDSTQVRSIEPRDACKVEEALAAALYSGVSAVKIGMTTTPEITQIIVRALASHTGPVVFDPVWTASNGSPLFLGSPSSLWPLLQRATLVTPNLHEASLLLERQVRTPVEARSAAHELFARGLTAVLVKGGHLEGEAVDFLVSAEGEARFSTPRIPGKSPRGTGCALGSTLAVALARGMGLGQAVAFAKAWITQAITHAKPRGEDWHLGS